MSPGAPDSILVRGPNWAGDLVMSTPGFRALRAAHPKSRIVLHVRRGLEPLMAGAPWFDHVSPFGGAGGPLAEGRRVSREHGPFDLGVCIPDSFSSALVMRAAKVGRIVGFRRGGRGPLLHVPVDPRPEWGRRRWVARERTVLALMEAAGAPASDTSVELFTTDAEERAADALLAEAGVAPDASLVALAPGASYGPSKCWPAESFARVGEALARAGHTLVLLGSPDEAAVTAAVADAMGAPAVDLAGCTDLGSAKALLRRAALLVANDAGARHLAAAFGTPSVLFFGPTSVAKTDLNLDRAAVLTAAVDCRPCYRRHCPIDHRCLTRIEPERAIDRARTALGGAGAR